MELKSDLKGVFDKFKKADRVKKLIDSFIATFDEEFAKYKNAIEQNDYDLAQKAIHTIKGVSGNIGLVQLHELCVEIDRKLKDNQEADYVEYGNRAKEFFEQIKTETKMIFS